MAAAAWTTEAMRITVWMTSALTPCWRAIFSWPLSADAPTHEIALVWRKGTLRRQEFELLGNELKALLR